MPDCCSPITHPPLIRRLGRRHGLNSQVNSTDNRRHSPIHILNDDVLLNIFHLYRLAYPAEYEDELNFKWDGQRWWYKLAHVCRLWRYIILESPSQLKLHLYCTNGIPIADMLAHSPPLPLTIHYHSMAFTAEDESGILLALSHRDRVRHINFRVLSVGKFTTAMDDQFPILERVYIRSWTEVVLPVTFQAPNLHHLTLSMASSPIGSPLLTTTASGLVTLSLLDIPESAYLSPSHILTRLSVMAQLTRLSITFNPIPNRDLERQSRSHQTPSDMITLPNLHRLFFRGTATYLDDLVAFISAPSLSIFRVNLLDQLPFAVPRLWQFIQSSENLTFSAVQVTFGAFAVSLHAVPWKLDTPWMLQIGCENLDLQVPSAVQLFGTLSPLLSGVEQVAFSYNELFPPPGWHNDVDPSQWRELLRPFTHAKTIHVHDDLISKIFRSLPSDDGESSPELLPNLEEIGYLGGSDALDAFITFLNQRQVVGHPVSLRLVDRSMFDIPQFLYGWSM